MMSEEGSLVEHTLFLAVTRPTMVMGVTAEALVLNAGLSMTLFLALGSMRYALLGIPMHLICRSICAKDPNAFRILAAWVETRGKARNRAVWGGSSISPLRLRRTYDVKDLES